MKKPHTFLWVLLDTTGRNNSFYSKTPGQQYWGKAFQDALPARFDPKPTGIDVGEGSESFAECVIVDLWMEKPISYTGYCELRLWTGNENLLDINKGTVIK